jgi:quinol---cytochrome c reductase iron-sulfur subunit
MTENDDHFEGLRGEQADGEQADEEGHAPVRRRVIGTPPPSAARRVFGDGGPAEAAVPERDLPAEPANPVRARRAERLVALAFVISFLGSAAFIASYVIFQVHTVDKAFRSNLALGLSMTVAFLALAYGATVWVRHLMPQVELTEERHSLRSDEQDRQAFSRTFTEGAEASQFVRRPLVRRSLLAALIPLALAPLVLLRDLGPLPRKKLRNTAWKKGTRLVVLSTNQPIRPADFSTPGSLITVVPEGTGDDMDAVAKAATIIIKFRPGELVFGKPSTPQNGFTVPNWTVDGIVAYSKICTHVGCPAALYEHTTHHILCPCHQSTFDAQRGAKVIFGPAPRPLPQLPITVDSEGYLVAQSDYTVPVGPSFWELG